MIFKPGLDLPPRIVALPAIVGKLKKKKKKKKKNEVLEGNRAVDLRKGRLAAASNTSTTLTSEVHHGRGRTFHGSSSGRIGPRAGDSVD